MSVTQPADLDARLRPFTGDRYDLDDLQDLAFDLGIDWRRLPGKPQAELVRELIVYLEHRDKRRRWLAHALGRGPSTDLARLLEQLPARLPYTKVQITISGGDALAVDLSELLPALARAFRVGEKEVLVLGAARGSARLLIGVPQAAASRPLPKIDAMDGGRPCLVSAASYDCLDPASQDAWRLLARNRPPVLEKGLLHLDIPWRDVLDAQKAAREGQYWLRCQSGSRKDNLENALELLQAARDMYARYALDDGWAPVVNDLAQAYQDRLCGDLVENHQEAICLYGQAQGVHTFERYPYKWAILQLNLGNAYRRYGAHSQTVDQQKAQDHYTRALRAFSEQHTPFPWSMTYNSLGVWYLEAAIGDRTENIEEALRCFERAKRVFRSAQSVDWADMTNNQGVAWRSRVCGSHAENIEQAIQCHKAALDVFDSNEHRVLWGNAHHNLGLCYAERIEGARKENLRQAREHLEKARRARRSAGMIREEALAEHQLIALGIMGQLGNQAERVEQAIQELERIRQILDVGAWPDERATIELALGHAYANRVRGDRVSNIETAIEHYQEAQSAITIDNAPAAWSYLEMGLAAAYRDRPLGDRRANLDRAVTRLGAKLDTLRERGWRSEWATMQRNLAGAFWERGRYYLELKGDPLRAAADFSSSLDHAHEALTVHTERDYPFEWAVDHYALASALSSLSSAEKDLELRIQAVEHYGLALQVLDTRDYPLQRAWALNDYGVTLLNLAYAAPERGYEQDLDHATQLFHAAIQTHGDTGLRTEALRSRINLGSLHHALKRWDQAYRELNEAIEVIETLRADALGESGHVYLADQYTRAYEDLVDTCWRLGECYWREALERMEASKGRAFLAEMGTHDYPVPEGVSPELSREEAELLNQLWQLDAELRDMEQSPLEGPARDRRRAELLRTKERATAAYTALLKQIKPLAPEYVALRRGYPAQYDALLPLLNDAGQDIAVIEVFPVRERVLILIVRRGWECPQILTTDLDRETLETNYLDPFDRALKGSRSRAWMGDLGDRLFRKAIDLLEGVDLVYLIPTGRLHALPLHALPVGSQSLIEHFAIAYAPSLTILSRVLERSRRQCSAKPGQVLVVGNPGGWPGDSLPPLTNAQEAARQVAERFGVQPLLGDEATKSSVLARLPQARIAFLNGHGRFDEQTALHSGLYLARTDAQDASHDMLTVREIMQLRLSAELVVLSACQTGRNRVGRGDELMGLARAFLYAGASAVVVALWSVSELSASDLMRELFDRLYPAGTKATHAIKALQASCLSVQDQYGHYFDWGPFVLVGDWK